MPAQYAEENLKNLKIFQPIKPDFLAKDVDRSIKKMIGEEPKNIMALMQLDQFEHLFQLSDYEKGVCDHSNTKTQK